MNDYYKITIDTCRILAKDKPEFLLYVKKATGITDKGISQCKYIKDVIKTFKI